MGIRERILKNEAKRLASQVVSEKNADKIANLLFDDTEQKTDETESIPINGSENELDSSEESTDSGLLSNLDSWLEEKEEKAKKQMDESPDPVTDLDSMEKRIDELEDK